ncbi:hypothetical protein DPMN_021435 [Dreissena polymorpha]|uniref:C2H2-type domain-containing protein n=1 Tax=Dreissena polymorpha TaxID=45954 RepID=A0A9D4NNR8_DREPO|nr:hypothetical protein DPMN_021435 [Dreissena polymorpha]
MKAHKNVCLGEKEYRCSMCESKYCRPALLRDHVIAVHQKVELKCPKCGKDIVYKSNLQRHLKNCIGN